MVRPELTYRQLGSSLACPTGSRIVPMTLDRRTFLSTAAAALAPPQDPPRSVLLLIGDDHSPIAGCYGNPVVATPNLDRLARQGVRFTHSFCTTASCSASRSVILTGLHNHTNGQYGHAHFPYNFHTHERYSSIPKLARARGIATGVIGKLHVLPPSVYPFDHEYGGGPGGGGTRDVWGMARNAADFFRKIAGRPFYLHVGYGDPHRGGDRTLFANDRDYPNVRKTVYSPADVVVPPFLPDRPEVRRELAEYYQAINRMDQGIGFLLDALEKSGRAADTLIIYVGDNGLPFPGAKGSCYDTGLSVPLIVAAPAMSRSGIVNRALVNCADLLPTALDWMGVPSPAYPLHGRSLLPVLEQESSDGFDEVFFSHTFHELNNYYPFRGIRTRRYKYIRFLYPELEMPLPSDLARSPTWQAVLNNHLESMGQRRTASVLRHSREELYDMEKDPLETANLAGSPEHASTLAGLRATVQKFRDESKDPWL
jgi:N-sulfoglucosamine sulfohydrolase